MIEKLRKINNKLIEINRDNDAELKKQKIIQKLLKEENLFFKISIEYAYAILRDLQIPESDIKILYMELIDAKNVNIYNKYSNQQEKM